MLSEEVIVQIYHWYQEGMRVRYIASHFNIAEPYVYSIVKGEVYKHLHSTFFPKEASKQ